MEVIKTKKRMLEVAKYHEEAHDRLVLVPTMGALHEGHLALVREAHRHGAPVVVSIFVNPIQFGPNEDFTRYPRDLEGDLAKLAPLNVAYCFAPEAKEMYPEGFQTRVTVEKLSAPLCGRFRPGHFAGVATVVLKLFMLCRPKVAIFGLKDFQQVRVVERMCEDLDLGVKIVRHKTVREPDGLAMSSRNAYLSEEERKIAPEIYRTLVWLREEALKGGKDPRALEEAGRNRLEGFGFLVDYVEIVDPETLEPALDFTRPCIALVAARLGSCRLIDNLAIVEADE